MPKVGEVVKTTSEIYGTYFQTCIGLVDLINGDPNSSKQPNVDEVAEWLEKYHPKHYFGSYACRDSESKSPWSFYIYIILDRHNTEWLNKNKDCQYLKDIGSVKGVKHIPIGIADKKLEKWLVLSNDYLVDKISL